MYMIQINKGKGKLKRELRLECALGGMESDV